jgi:hypothetical protein
VGRAVAQFETEETLSGAQRDADAVENDDDAAPDPPHVHEDSEFSVFFH